MKKKIYISLKFELTFVFTLLLALISFSVYYYFSQKYEEENLTNLQQKFNSITLLAADGVSSGLYHENQKSSEEKFELLLTNEEIRYVNIFKDDSLYYEYNTSIAMLNNYKNTDGELASSKWKIMKSHAPINFEEVQIGDIYIGFSLTSVYSRIDEIKAEYRIVCLILFLVGLILIYFILKIFLSPLDILVKAAGKMIEGDLTQRINLKSSDEFGFLSEGFNLTVEKLASSDKEMIVITRELEKRVKDRTVELEGALKSLQRENTQRKKAEVEISNSLHEKEVLLKEIHHRVKNNLQIVSSLFFFQSKQITDPVTLEMFRDGQNRVKSMALIHEKLYQSGDLAHIDFKEYIKKLSNFLLQSYGVNQTKIRLKINIQKVELGVDTAVPCGLIINELISNSLKHGFPEKDSGEIKIDFGYDENNKLILKISDNGKGIPKDFDVENSDSLGLRLVNNLTTQLNGKVDYYNNNGTIVKLVFPNPNHKKAS